MLIFTRTTSAAASTRPAPAKTAFFEPTEDTFYGFDIALNMKEGTSVRWDTRFIFERMADDACNDSKS